MELLVSDLVAIAEPGIGPALCSEISDLVAIAEPSISPALCSEISDLVAVAEPGIGPALCSELPQGSVGGGGGDGEGEGGGAGGVEATHLSLEVPRVAGLVKQAVFLEEGGGGRKW